MLQRPGSAQQCPRDSPQTSRTATSRKAVAVRKAQAKGAHNITSTTWQSWAQTPALQPPALQPACSAITLRVAIDTTAAAGRAGTWQIARAPGLQNW